MREKKMPAVLRHELILKKLEVKGFATTLDFSRWLSVSDMTIRRDLDHLAEKGLLIRTHGGAVALSGAGGHVVDLVEPKVSERELRAREAKAAIARCALEMIEPDQTIALDVGTTTLALADLLRDSRISLFTSSLKIASRLAETRPQVYVPAGRICGSEPSVVGPQAIDFFRGFHFDIAFIGASGLTREGLFDYSLDDAEVKRAFVERSRTTVALLDSTKFNRISVATICTLEALDVVITDAEMPTALHEALISAGVRVEVAAAQTLEGTDHDL